MKRKQHVSKKLEALPKLCYNSRILKNYHKGRLLFYEWKREKGLYQKSLQERRVRGFWQIKDGPLFTFAPADDEDWNKVKDDARGVVDFVLGSFFASGVFCVLYLIVGILD